MKSIISMIGACVILMVINGCGCEGDDEVADAGDTTQEEAVAALPVGTLDPGYLPYGGPVPGVPQASDMQAWQEALASARAKVAYQTEAQTLAGLPQYTPVPGVSAPAAAAVVQPTRRYNPALDLF